MSLRRCTFFVFLVILIFILAACGQDTPIGGLGTPTAPFATVGSGRAVTTLIANTEATVDTIATDVALPACMPTPPTIVPLPDNFPNFPLPTGFKVVKSSLLNNNPNSIQIVGYVPLGLRESVLFLVDELPKRGYKLGYGDSEVNEAESQFSGNGWRGGFLVRGVYQCATGSLWRVVMLKQE